MAKPTKNQSNNDENAGGAQGGNMVPSTSSKSPTSEKSDAFRDRNDRTTDNNVYSDIISAVRRP